MLLQRQLKRTLATLLLGCLFTQAGLASELSDSMRLYFSGDYQGVQQSLTALAQRGTNDARVYYFLGLAKLQLGDAQAAAEDFTRGAELEIEFGSQHVGQALQRVQGVERLDLEKHRRLARLKRRSRAQGIAPAPIQRDEAVRFATGRRDPRAEIRLASEVPLASTPFTNPFVDAPAEPQQSPSPDPRPELTPRVNLDNEAVGTGVVRTTNIEADDIFGVGETSAAKSSSTSDSPTRGVLGAIFRAVGKAAIPQIDATRMLPGGFGNSGEAAPSPAGPTGVAGKSAATDESNEGLFGEGPGEDSDIDDENPFGDF